MNSPIELLKKTELILFSLEPKEARKLKDKTISLLNDCVVSKEEHLALAHQINQIRKIKKNFLSWLECYCSCEECKEN